ncbi:FAR1-related sequence 5-like protein [Tanacetum coccineum]
MTTNLHSNLDVFQKYSDLCAGNAGRQYITVFKVSNAQRDLSDSGKRKVKAYIGSAAFQTCSVLCHRMLHNCGGMQNGFPLRGFSHLLQFLQLSWASGNSMLKEDVDNLIKLKAGIMKSLVLWFEKNMAQHFYDPLQENKERVLRTVMDVEIVVEVVVVRIVVDSIALVSYSTIVMSSDATVVEPDAQTIHVDQQQMVKTLGIVHVTDDGVKFYKLDVPDSVKPLKGKLFNTLEDALHFYKTYAKLSGFEARKSTEYKRKYGKIKQKYFVCSREGFKPIAIMGTLVDNFEKLEIKKAKRKRKRPSCRCGCLARVILDITAKNKYVVCSFDEEHNYPFVDEDDISLLKSSWKLTFSKKQLLFRVSNNNIGPMKAFKMMKDLFGGFDEVGATSVDYKNFRLGINLFIGEYDAEMVVELLMNKQEYINGFLCNYFTNDDGNLSGLFWADEVAKHNYLSFGEVISFDATFRSNKYKMLFVPFTGIDNHQRSVTLVAALLSNETSESYGWLLRAFKKAFGREPMVVVTDQSNEDSSRKGVKQFKTSIVYVAHHGKVIY